jgi:hypothetical protein
MNRRADDTAARQQYPQYRTRRQTVGVAVPGQKQTSAPHVAGVKSSEFASISVRDIARMSLDRGSQIKRAGEEPWADYQSD